jgi:O-antigen ligase
MIYRVARSAAWIVAAAACALPLQALSGSFPPSVIVAFGLFAVLACLRPVDALIVLAGLGPLAGVASGLAGGPFDGGRPLEALVLILIAGSCLHAAAVDARAPSTAFEWSLAALAAIAVASLVARLPVLVLTVGRDNASLLWDLFRRSYFERLLELGAVAQTALLVEGAALAALAARAARAGAGSRLASAMLLGAAGAAALSVYRLLEIALRQPQLGEALSALVLRTRIAPQYTDLNAAGSYFALVGVLVVALAGRGSARAIFASLTAAALVFALWLSGSRIALGAALAAAVAFFAIRPGAMHRAVHRKPFVLIATAALLVAIVAAPFAYTSARNGTLGYSVFTRVELFKAGMRMVAERPMFGVGTTQFYDSFARYASPALLDEFRIQLGVPVTKENAHNNFLQIFAELGVIGLAAFLAILIFSLRGSMATDDRLRRGAALAVLAYLLTCMAGHPLLIPLAAYPFWMVVGLTAGLRPAAERMGTPLARRLVLVTVVLLAVTVPWRMRYERQVAHLDGLTFGFSDWRLDEHGTRFQSAGGRATLFVPHSVRYVQLPLRSPDANDRVVTVELDGRRAAQIRVPGGGWMDARVPMPATDRPLFRRLDLVVESGGGGRDGRDERVSVGRPLMVGPG